MTANSPTSDLIARAGCVLGSPGVPNRGTAETVAIRNGRIATSVGHDSRVLVDEPDGLIVPAIADAHDHGRPAGGMAFGAPDGALETWLPAVRRLPRVDPEVAATAFYGDLLRSGVTAAMHLERPSSPERLLADLPVVGRTAAAMGMSIALAVPLADQRRLLYVDDGEAIDALRQCGFPGDPSSLLPEDPPPVAEQLALVDAVAAAVDDPRINVQYGPTGPQWASDELLEGVAEASERTGRRIHMHLLETERQRVWSDREHPGGAVKHLDRIGLLSDRLSVAHGVWLRPEELELLAERGVTVVVNASSNLRLRSGIAPGAAAIAAGVPVALGLDGTTLDDDLDAFREARLFRLLQAGTGMSDALSAGDVFRAASDVGHRAVTGEGGPWRLQAGDPADMVVIDRKRMLHDVVVDVDDAEAVLSRATTGHVKHVISHGSLVVRDGVVLAADVPAARRAVTEELRSHAAALAGSAAAVVPLQAAIGAYYDRETS